MTAVGYQRKFRVVGRHICFAPDSRHSSADVRFRADFVHSTPNSGRFGHPLERRPRRFLLSDYKLSAPSALAWRKIGKVGCGLPFHRITLGICEAYTSSRGMSRSMLKM